MHPQIPFNLKVPWCSSCTSALQRVEEQHHLSPACPKQLAYLKECRTGQFGGRRGLGTGMWLPAAIAYLPILSSNSYSSWAYPEDMVGPSSPSMLLRSWESQKKTYRIFTSIFSWISRARLQKLVRELHTSPLKNSLDLWQATSIPNRANHYFSNYYFKKHSTKTQVCALGHAAL